MASTVRLSQIPVGSRATVRGLPARSPAFLRLREMGLSPGTPVTLVRTAPLGDPLEIQVRGYSLTLRKTEAENVLVEPLPAAD